jgi:hypothetical protein
MDVRATAAYALAFSSSRPQDALRDYTVPPIRIE